MAIITGMSGRILGQTGVSAAFSNKPTTDIGAVARTIYRITDATLRSWDRSVVPVVETSPNGTTGWVAATGYTVQYLGGTITFAVAQANPTFVRVSGNAYPMAAFTYFTSWELNGEVAMLDVTSIGDASEVVTPGLLKGSVKGDGFFVDSYFATKLTTNAVAIVSLDTGAGTYDLCTYVSKLGTKDTKGAVTTESKEFTVSGNFYFNIP